jgi:hypothetical protein
MDYQQAVNDIKREALQEFRKKMHESMEELERRIGTLPNHVKRQWRDTMKAIYEECKPQGRSNS